MLGLRLHFFRVSLGLTWSFLGGLKKREGVRGRAPVTQTSMDSMFQKQRRQQKDKGM